MFIAEGDEAMDDTFLLQEQIEEVAISTGAHFRLPVKYYDCSSMNAFFSAPAAKVRALLPSNKLKPILLIPGVAIVAFTATEYNKIEGMAPYNEFAISVPVQYEPAVIVPGLPVIVHPLLSPDSYRRFRMYILHLPVTTPEAQAFGKEVWGYPKFIAEIDFEDIEDVRRCRLRAEGRDILTLEIEKPATRDRQIDLHTYSVKNGKLLRSRFQTQGQYGIARLPGGASYRLGNHTVAQGLRALGLGKSAVGRFYVPRMQSLLHQASESLPL